MKIENSNYMDVKMISEYLHVAKSTIYKWVESGFIPHQKLRKKVLFVKNHIDDWVLSNGEAVIDLPVPPKQATREIQVPIKKDINTKRDNQIGKERFITNIYKRSA